MSFAWRRRLVLFNRAQMAPGRTVSVHLPRFNLGCLGFRAGSWYMDLYRRPGPGLFFNTPVARGWFSLRTWTWRSMR